ncbi:hypothetical protein ABZS84_37295 [Streptomyces sp. NPDC005481]|uniref:hypothetical protein n=1 Tax=Streptomyces sp. NPDC005481 TaxID=3154881 RepID=UPI0033A88FEA
MNSSIRRRDPLLRKENSQTLLHTEKRVDGAVDALPALAWSSGSHRASADRLRVTSLRVERSG